MYCSVLVLEVQQSTKSVESLWLKKLISQWGKHRQQISKQVQRICQMVIDVMDKKSKGIVWEISE